MDPIIIAWIAAVAGGATAGKLVGIFLRRRGFGLVGNPVIALLGGVVVWQAGVRFGGIPVAEWPAALLLGVVGGAFLLSVVGAFRKAR